MPYSNQSPDTYMPDLGEQDDGEADGLGTFTDPSENERE